MQVHKRVEFEHNGERAREESAWSWECSCGACESAHLKSDAVFEWQMHVLTHVLKPSSRLVDCCHGALEIEKNRTLGLSEVRNILIRILRGLSKPSQPVLEIIERNIKISDLV